MSLLLQEGVREAVDEVESRLREHSGTRLLPVPNSGPGAGGLFLDVVLKAYLDMDGNGFVSVRAYVSRQSIVGFR